MCVYLLNVVVVYKNKKRSKFASGKLINRKLKKMQHCFILFVSAL